MTSGKEKEKANYRPALGIALVSLLLCGLFFPLLITGLAQLIFPYQANGEIVQVNGRAVGSSLIDNNFKLPIFFHARPANESASRVDPDITVQNAYSQIPRIHDATGIPSDSLRSIVSQNVEGTLWVFGSPYVNVLRMNLALMKAYPSTYADFK